MGSKSCQAHTLTLELLQARLGDETDIIWVDNQNCDDDDLTQVDDVNWLVELLFRT